MTNITHAPSMRIRRHDHDNDLSFQTTETIPATRAALHEYMQRHSLGTKFSAAELASIKYRHQNAHNQEASKDLRNKDVWWGGAWSIVYISDRDRALADVPNKGPKKKVPYPHTQFGYCNQFPVA